MCIRDRDNDVYGTDYCIGFSTAVTRSVQFIHQLRTSTGSHERIAVVELFGRNSGETSLISSYLASVDRALISEVPFDVEKLAKLVMKDKKGNPSNYAMVTISEGAHFLGGQVVEYGEADAYGHKKLGGIGQLGEAGHAILVLRCHLLPPHPGPRFHLPTTPATATPLTRLSDLLFVLARYANLPGGDVLWAPGGGREQPPTPS